MLDVISQDNSRNYVLHFEMKAEVTLQEERVRAKRRDLRSETPSPGSPPPFPGLSPAHRPSLSSPQAPSSSSCLHIPSAGISSWVVGAAGRVWTYLPLFDIPPQRGASSRRSSHTASATGLDPACQLSSPAQLCPLWQLFCTQSSL